MQQKSQSTDDWGQAVESWQTLMTVWGNVRYGSGMSAVRVNADQPDAGAMCSIRIRTSTCSMQVQSGMRVQYTLRGQVQTLDVVDVRPQPKGYLDLVCK